MPKTPATAPEGPKSPQPSDDVQLPHERDTATGGVTAEVPEVMRQARKDLDAGLVDTDLRNAPGVDGERRKALLERERKRR